MAEWKLVEQEPPPENEIVDTLSENGLQQTLKLRGRLWFAPDGSMYVYYTPKFWARLKAT